MKPLNIGMIGYGFMARATRTRIGASAIFSSWTARRC